jgi:hypothetical protein
VVPLHGFVAALSHPAQALLTQKCFAALLVQRVLSTHSTHWPARFPVVAQAVLPSVCEEHPVAPLVLQPVQTFATQKPFAASFVHWLSAEHSTHWPADIPAVAQTVLPSARAPHPVDPEVLQPVHTFATQKPLATSFVHWLSAEHSTHSPADVPVVAQTVLPSVLEEQPVAPLVLQPVHTFATQKPLAASLVHWLSAEHSTHCPADVPAVAQTVLPSVRAEHPVAPAVLQPVHDLATQNPFAGSVVHSLSAVHPTHMPEVRSHADVGAAHALTPADWHPTQTPATQKAFVGSVQSPFTPQVPAASGTREESGSCWSIGASGIVPASDWSVDASEIMPASD